MKLAYKTVSRFNSTNRNKLQKINEVLEEYQSLSIPITLRQLYYELVARMIIPNTDLEYKKLGKLLSTARLCGYVDWDIIVDNGRIPDIVSQFENLAELSETAINSYRKNRWENQEYYVEVWAEKDAIASTLEDITKKYCVPFIINRGYSSITAIHEAAMRFDENQENKDCVILYLGDHDPSGLDMERYMAERLNDFGVTPEIKRIGLTLEQIQEFQLPPNPAKQTDPRFDNYFEEYGNGSWELEALNIKTLRVTLENEIKSYLDFGKYNEVLEQESQDIERFKKITEELENV